MTTVDVLSPEGEKTGSVELPAEVFDTQANLSLMHQVVVAQLAAKRQGTAKAKTRGEVSGGGAKPYRQKGTGRARQGSTRAPQFVGGGVVHGPQPRSYAQKTPKKMKAAALRGALSDRARAGLVYVVSSIVSEGEVKTKAALGTLRSVVDIVDNPRKRLLVVLDRGDLAGWVSLRNVPAVHLLVADQLNTYDVLVSDAVVFTESALQEFLGEGSGGAASVEVVVDPTSDEATAAGTAEEMAELAAEADDSTAVDVADAADDADTDADADADTDAETETETEESK